MSFIPGGFIIKARKIQESKIAHAPPHIREIWDWLIRTVNHIDNSVCQRGQTIKNIKDIQEALSWFQGWRKHTYSQSECENAMKWLRKAEMIATRKTVRGMVITVLNYDKFQDQKNYECRTESRISDGTTAEAQPNYKQRMKKNEKKKGIKQQAAAPEQPEENFSHEEKVTKMLTSNDQRMPIIARYWQSKGFIYENKSQYEAALKRELRAAKDLTGYTLEQVQKTLDWLKNNANFKWTLETVGKYINEPLDALNVSGKPKSDDDWMQELRAKERLYATQQFT